MMKVILVDDERLARKRLASLLEAHADITIVGEAGTLAAAAELAVRVRPEVVFLDVQMPPDEGFTLLPLLPLTTRVVFVTAFDQYALQAFEVAAIDYLLKPVAPARLALTLKRLNGQGSEAAAREIVIKGEEGLLKLNVDSIRGIQADGAYTKILNLDYRIHHVRRTMKEWRELLPEDRFPQLDRSMIVNLKAIHRLRIRNRDEGELFFSEAGTPLQIGRQAIRKLRSQLPASIAVGDVPNLIAISKARTC